MKKIIKKALVVLSVLQFLPMHSYATSESKVLAGSEVNLIVERDIFIQLTGVAAKRKITDSGEKSKSDADDRVRNLFGMCEKTYNMRNHYIRWLVEQRNNTCSTLDKQSKFKKTAEPESALARLAGCSSVASLNKITLGVDFDRGVLKVVSGSVEPPSIFPFVQDGTWTARRIRSTGQRFVLVAYNTEILAVYTMLSSDGVNWSELVDFLDNGSGWRSIETNDGHLYRLRNAATLMHSSDRGKTWTERNFSDKFSWLENIAYREATNSIVISGRHIPDNGKTIMVGRDNGKSWTTADTPNLHNQAPRIMTYIPQLGKFIAIAGNDILLSSDTGKTWIQHPTSLHLDGTDLVFLDNRLMLLDLNSGLRLANGVVFGEL
jgi:photosystem II stability/assembly factor-like uncharacterized protein